MDRCWKCGSPMTKNSRERICTNCGRTVQRHKNSTPSYNDSTSGDVGTLGALLGLGLLGLAFASSKKNTSSSDDIEIPDYVDYSYLLEEEEKQRKRRAWAKKHKKGIAICILAMILSSLLFVAYHESQLLIPLGFDSSSLDGMRYTEVVQLLKESGFTNIQTKEISDLTLSREDEHDLVTEINLLHTSEFDETTKYPSNLWITVVYHTIELYAPPLSAKEAKGMNYSDIVEAFEDAGFINIIVNIEYDIITGWLTDDGEVESVTINGEKKFTEESEFRPDAEIVITYHTLRKNKETE